MDEKIEQLAKDLKLIKELQASDIYTANYQEARALFSLGYRKESDTAREILAKLLNMGERAILNDIINPYECFFVSFDKFKKIAEKFGVDLGE